MSRAIWRNAAFISIAAILSPHVRNDSNRLGVTRSPANCRGSSSGDQAWSDHPASCLTVGRALGVMAERSLFSSQEQVIPGG